MRQRPSESRYFEEHDRDSKHANLAQTKLPHDGLEIAKN